MVWFSSPVLFSVQTHLTRTTRMLGIRDSLRRISSTSVRPSQTNPPSSRSQTNKTRNHSRTIRMSSTYLNNSADPVERTSSPYPDPRELGPKSKILATRTGNYHSTSLRNMVTINTVNKTALHPGGVQYVLSPRPTSSAVIEDLFDQTKS